MRLSRWVSVVPRAAGSRGDAGSASDRAGRSTETGRSTGRAGLGLGRDRRPTRLRLMLNRSAHEPVNRLRLTNGSAHENGPSGTKRLRPQRAHVTGRKLPWRTKRSLARIVFLRSGVWSAEDTRPDPPAEGGLELNTATRGAASQVAAACASGPETSSSPTSACTRRRRVPLRRRLPRDELADVQTRAAPTSASRRAAWPSSGSSATRSSAATTARKRAQGKSTVSALGRSKECPRDRLGRAAQRRGLHRCAISRLTTPNKTPHRSSPGDSGERRR